MWEIKFYLKNNCSSTICYNKQEDCDQAFEVIKKLNFKKAIILDNTIIPPNQVIMIGRKEVK